MPRIVHQTWKTADIEPWFFKQSQPAIRKYLPNWDYRFWTDADLEQFVQAEFPVLFERWRGFDRPIKRVDMARYCLLYKFGGLYADLDFIFTGPLDEILDENYDLFFYRSTQAIVKGWNFLGNAFMVSKPGQRFWLDVMEYMIGLAANTAVLHHTGPLALGAYYASLEEKPKALIFGPEYFDNNKCQDGVGEHRYGYHMRTATWQRS